LQRMQFSTTTKGMNASGEVERWRSLGDSNPCSSLERAVS
jgi:hypothetical protein